jgi:hypothetical protein
LLIEAISYLISVAFKELIPALAPTAPGEATRLYCRHHAKPTKQESAFILARNDGRSLLLVSPKHNGFCFPATALAHAAWSARGDSNSWPSDSQSNVLLRQNFRLTGWTALGRRWDATSKNCHRPTSAQNAPKENRFFFAA